MFDWFSSCWGGSDEEFSPLLEGGSATRPCVLHPTVSVLGRDEDVVFAEVDLKAFGGPWDSRGEYAWSVVEGTCWLSSKKGSRITAMRETPGEVRVRVTYAIGENRSEPAEHTIRFRAPPVYVIGAGAAGLKAASVLLDQGFKVVLCEATGAVGGRARTVDALGGAFKVDLGCNWLHGDEWRWELESRSSIQNLGFKIDDQREAYPGLEALWPFREDVIAAVRLCDGFVKKGLATHSQKPAAALLDVFEKQDQKPDFSKIKRNHIEREAEVLTREQAEKVFHESGDAIDARAIKLAADKAAGTPTTEEGDLYLREESRETSDELERLIGSQEASDKLPLARLRKRATDEIKRQRREVFVIAFKRRDEQALLAVEAQRKKAHGLVHKETHERHEKEHGPENQERIKKLFAEHEKRFDEMCRRAYEIARAKEGSLEEALEYDQFSNYDREGGPSESGEESSSSDGEPDLSDEEEVALDGPHEPEQSGDNAWYLGGYGGLLVSYAEHLVARHGEKLWVRRNTAVASVCYGDGELPKLKLAGRGGEVRASAVVVTVSAGVINAGHLTFEGPSAKTVHDHYGCILMGNYKKVVLVFDRAAKITPIPGAQDASTHRPTSVYWHIDEKGLVWKFLVPDSFRKVVIAIVGGTLAGLLDGFGDEGAIKIMRGELHALGIVDEAAKITEHFVTNWRTDKAFLGAYSSTAPGGGGRRKLLMAQPLLAYGVTLAGEALNDEYGTAHAAFLSGERAANSIVSVLPRLEHDTKDNM